MLRNEITVNIIIPLFNKEDSVSATIESILHQVPPSNVLISILIVNDASTDNSLLIAEQFNQSNPSIEVIALPTNSGRSTACNTGIFYKKSDYSIIVDADCTWDNPDTLKRYIHLFRQNKNLVLGHLCGNPNTFWGNYYNKLNHKRASSPYLLEQATSANFGCKTEYLRKAGGFSTQYQHYGFEDRDLFLTLKKIPIPADEITFDRDISASNNDTPTLYELSEKLMQAGQHTSLIFHHRHPYEYSRSPYYPFDTRLKNKLTANVIRQSMPILRLFLTLSIKLFDIPGMPTPVKSLMVKVCTAVSFTLGTLHS